MVVVVVVVVVCVLDVVPVLVLVDVDFVNVDVVVVISFGHACVPVLLFSYYVSRPRCPSNPIRPDYSSDLVHIISKWSDLKRK